MKNATYHLLQATLSVIFVYAAITKFMDRQVFYDSILAYQLFSPELAKLAAHTIPYLELILAAGIWVPKIKQTSYAMYSTLMLIFTVLKIYAYSQGLDLSCGCFGKLIPTSQVNGIFQNLGILCILMMIYVLGRRDKSDHKT